MGRGDGEVMQIKAIGRVLCKWEKMEGEAKERRVKERQTGNRCTGKKYEREVCQHGG